MIKTANYFHVDFHLAVAAPEIQLSMFLYWQLIKW